MERVTIKIKGMTCGGCVASVERVLMELDGVDKVTVSLEQGQASVEYAPGKVNASDLQAAIEDAGYEVVP
jgi:copper chaperone